MEKQINISILQGYEIDQVNSTFECIKFIPKKSSTPLNIVTHLGMDDECTINGRWAFTIFKNGEVGTYSPGEKVTKCKATIYLPDCNGQWYNEKGEEIEGYLFYVPHK